jgi:HAD superfamily hydrolase (TIGR01490 family)
LTNFNYVTESRRDPKQPSLPASDSVVQRPFEDGPRAAPAGIYPGRVTTSGPHAAAFFDLDKTVIARSSTLAFSRPLYAGGLISRRAALRSTYTHFLYLLGRADHDQMERMRGYLSSLVVGWHVQQVRDIVAETLLQIIEPVVHREAVTLIAEHHAAGRDVVIVSTSGSELVEPIAAMLGADLVIATRMTVRDGQYTGDIDFYAYHQNKATAIRELAAKRGYDLTASYAYSDSATDVPMLETVGHPYAVNPDRALRREAAVRGWPVLDFSDPAPLRRRLAGQLDRVPRTPGSWVVRAAAAAAAAAALAGTAVLAWLVLRRRPFPTAA